MRHADLRREATTVIAKPTSALLNDTAAWYLVWVCVFCGGMSDAMRSKNRCTTFSTEFFDWQIQSKKPSFSTKSPSRTTQSKKMSRKDLFRLRKKARLGLQSKKAIFD